MQGHDLAHEGQAETQPAGVSCSRTVTLPEAIKHMREQLRGNALPRVLDSELGEAAQGAQTNGNFSTAGRELQAVGQQVGYHLLQAIRIAAQLPRTRLDIGV